MATAHRAAAGSARIFVGLGSNVGDRASNLRRALERLAEREVAIVQTSGVYETEAHVLDEDGPQPDFLNAVAEVQTKLGPEELMTASLDVERDLGRRREAAPRWRPRTIDIDLLMYGDVSLTTQRLVLPHPRLPERRFVLEPFAEIDPAVHIPEPINSTVGELLERCADLHPVRRIGDPATLYTSIP